MSQSVPVVDGYSVKVIVTGGRDYSDLTRLSTVLDMQHIAEPITSLAHGGARGADTLADSWARRVGLDPKVYRADWASHGKAAGVIRNGVMLKDFDPDLVIAFPGGVGTKHMVSITRRAGVRLLMVGDRIGEIYVIPEYPI